MKKDLILQVNIPFCTRRCAYCGSTVCAYDPSVSAAYVKALLREIEAAAPEAQDHRVRAVSLEGGCPTLLEPAGLQTVLRAIRHSFALAEDVQISLQTMPGDYSRALMEKMRDNGVNFWIVGLETAELPEHELLRRPYRFDALTMVVCLRIRMCHHHRYHAYAQQPPLDKRCACGCRSGYHIHRPGIYVCRLDIQEERHQPRTACRKL